MQLNDLSNEQLVCRLRDLRRESRRIDVQLITLLIEVEQRRLHLEMACSSIFDFCMHRLGLSGATSYRRMTAARLAARFPTLLGHLESGRIHLSALMVLGEHLTEANVEELVSDASGMSTRQLKELLAKRSPRPDVPASIRKLSSVPDVGDLSADGLSRGAAATSRTEPLSEGRYEVRLTVGAEQHAKLERARDLIRHRVPSGDLAEVFDAALDALLEKLEKERLGKVAHPRKAAASAPAVKPGHITSAVRREVFERDGEQCTFVDEHDRRCSSRTLLELDHIQARARGGTDDAANLRVLCRAHNRLHAEKDFGAEYVDEQIHFQQRKSAQRDRNEILRMAAELAAEEGELPPEAYAGFDDFDPSDYEASDLG